MIGKVALNVFDAPPTLGVWCLSAAWERLGLCLPAVAGLAQGFEVGAIVCAAKSQGRDVVDLCCQCSTLGARWRFQKYLCADGSPGCAVVSPGLASVPLLCQLLAVLFAELACCDQGGAAWVGASPGRTHWHAVYGVGVALLCLGFQWRGVSGHFPFPPPKKGGRGK